MAQANEIKVNGSTLAALIGGQRSGWALEQPFYTDAQVFERDVERIFMRDWLYVGHVSQIPARGDYLTFRVANESVIVARGDDGAIHALLNVCRHRGSRVCNAAQGNADWLVCPYHGWTYGLDGGLRAARQMPKDFDKAAHGLKPIHVESFHGLMFVNFADNPASFAPVRAALDEHLAPYALERAKVAHRALYPIDANWKLTLENYLECYHCAPSHPEFSESHSIKNPASRQTRLHAALVERSKACGVSPTLIDHAHDHEGVQFYYDRYALFDGYLTGSRDGQPVAPLLGSVEDFDRGASNLQVGPVSHILIYSDHAVVYRFTPIAPRATDCEIIWLVREGAEEGSDYNLDRLTWLWDVTTEEDKLIIERNQAGVGSRFYRPGPYAPMERSTRQFVDWYLWVIS